MPNITDGAKIKYICWKIGENIQIVHHGMETFLSGLESMLYSSLAGSGKNNTSSIDNDSKDTEKQR